MAADGHVVENMHFSLSHRVEWNVFIVTEKKRTTKYGALLNHLVLSDTSFRQTQTDVNYINKQTDKMSSC